MPVPGGTKRKTTTKRDEEEGWAWVAEMERVYGGDEPEVIGAQSVGEYLEEWLRDAIEPSVSPSTHDKRSWAVNEHIRPALGGVKLRELDARRIQALYASMARAGYAYSTRREIHVTLKMALSQALKWGLVRRNECEIADAPRDVSRPDSEEKVRHLTNAQAGVFFWATKDERWHNYFVAAIRTGLRPGEMLGLWWEDLDLDADPGSLRVRRTLDPHRLVFNPPKTARSRRSVALHREAKAAFLAQREMLGCEGFGAGAKDLVFPSSTGTRMQADNLRKRYLKPHLAAASLPELTLHELRHTFASIMLHEWHIAAAVVSEAMGHKDIAFTFRIYGHLIESAQADVMRRLNAEQELAEAG